MATSEASSRKDCKESPNEPSPVETPDFGCAAEEGISNFDLLSCSMSCWRPTLDFSNERHTKLWLVPHPRMHTSRLVAVRLWGRVTRRMRRADELGVITPRSGIGS